MKPLFVLSLALFTFGLASGQTLPNTFKVGNYVEVLPNDSIKIWYNCVGAISNRSCASFYRLGKIDPETIGVTGDFCDYDVNGHLIYKAQMHNSKLSGKAWFYYPDGGVKETGEYVSDERKGVWKYYYANGSAEKVFDFEGGSPDIIQAYDVDGRPTVSDGNGNYSGRFAAVGQCDGSWPISGAVKNGKMDGEWKFAVLSTELYDNGKFIKGINSKNYGGGEYNSNQPRIKVSGFYANEETQLYENHVGCPGDQVTLFKFGSKSLTAGFYPDLIKKIKSYPGLKNQWLIVAISFNRSDHIKALNVYSSKDDTELEGFVYSYLKDLKGWKPWSATSESSPPLFFTINIDLSLGNENVMIPAEYMIRQQMRAMQLPEGN